MRGAIVGFRETRVRKSTPHVTLVSHVHEEASFSLAVPGPSWGPGFFFARGVRIARAKAGELSKSP
jgi:hypothetical protein